MTSYIIYNTFLNKAWIVHINNLIGSFIYGFALTSLWTFTNHVLTLIIVGPSWHDWRSFSFDHSHLEVMIRLMFLVHIVVNLSSSFQDNLTHVLGWHVNSLMFSFLFNALNFHRKENTWIDKLSQFQQSNFFCARKKNKD